jgi:hypothetical protein
MSALRVCAARSCCCCCLCAARCCLSLPPCATGIDGASVTGILPRVSAISYLLPTPMHGKLRPNGLRRQPH